MEESIIKTEETLESIETLKIKEIDFCEVCLGEIKEGDLVWIRGISYCECCVDKDVELTKKLREAEREMLKRIMDMIDDEKSKKELLETFGEYFGIQVINETIPVM